MKYKIGDIAKVRNDLQKGEMYDDCEVLEGMLDYTGLMYIIDKIDIDGTYRLKTIGNPEDTNYYAWHEDMLEPVTMKNNLKQYTHVDEMKGGNSVKYKIGDLVKVRDDLQEDKMYGGCSSIDDMLKFRGTLDFIENIDDDGDYHLANNNNPYVWSEEMLEPVVIKNNSKHEMKEKNSMEYKIGDVVRIKDNLQEGEKYGECNVNKDMLKFRGATTTIEGIDEDGDFYLANKDDYYAWYKDMLEPVEIKESTTPKIDRLGIYQYLLNNLEETYRDTNDNDQDNTIVDIYDKFGDTSFLIRILERYNELSRLCNPNEPQELDDEKINETILDLANHCLLWLTEREYRSQ